MRGGTAVECVGVQRPGRPADGGDTRRAALLGAGQTAAKQRRVPRLVLGAARRSPQLRGRPHWHHQLLEAFGPSRLAHIQSHRETDPRLPPHSPDATHTHTHTVLSLCGPGRSPMAAGRSCRPQTLLSRGCPPPPRRPPAAPAAAWRRICRRAGRAPWEFGGEGVQGGAGEGGWVGRVAGRGDASCCTTWMCTYRLIYFHVPTDNSR
jgi:hypothetical protein